MDMKIKLPPGDSRMSAKDIEALVAPHAVGDKVFSISAEVDPSLAQRLLSANLPGNRRTPPSAIRRLARVIGTPQWRLNGESLKISTEGYLIDGQTRLRACLEADRPFRTVIMFGLAPDSYDSMDQARRRKVSDALARNAVPRPTTVAAVILAVDAIRHRRAPGGGGWYGSDAEEAVDFVEKNQRLLDSVALAHPARHIVNSSVLAALHFLFTEKDPVGADAFMVDLASGINAKAIDPVFIARERLIKDAHDRAQRNESINRWTVCGWLIHAWNCRRHGKLTKFSQRPFVTDEEETHLLYTIA